MASLLQGTVWISIVHGSWLNQIPVLNVEEVISPCIGVCTLGPGDLCIGCFRSSGEISNWLNFSLQDRNHIIDQLPKRLESLFTS